jgi:hypothetical protein
MENVNLEEVITAALSPDNAARNAAERCMDHLIDTSAETFVFELLKLARTAADVQVRTLTAIYLKNQLGRGEEALLDRLSPPLQEAIKTETLAGVRDEPERYARAQLCALVVEVASLTLFKDAWPHLFPFLFDAVAATSPPQLRITGFELFASLAESVQDALDARAGDVGAACAATLTAAAAGDDDDATFAVKAAALRAATMTATFCLPSDDDDKANSPVYAGFQSLLPPALALLVTAAQTQSRHAAAATMLKRFIDLAAEDSGIYRPALPQLCEVRHARSTNTYFANALFVSSSKHPLTHSRQFYVCLFVFLLPGGADGIPGPRAARHRRRRRRRCETINRGVAHHCQRDCFFDGTQGSGIQ